MPSSKNPTPTPPIFKFRNIGPIKEAELELGDLTIIAGRNNTGKTYLTYTLYGFLNMNIPWQYFIGDEHDFDEINTLFKKASKEGVAKTNMSAKRLTKLRQEVANTITRIFSTQSLADIFSSSSQNFKDSAIEIKFNDELPILPRCEIIIGGSIHSMEYHNEELIVSVNIQDGDQALSPHMLPVALYLQFLFPEFLLNPFILPAERFGIALFHRELDFTRNQLVDLLQKVGNRKDQGDLFPYFIINQNTSRYAVPIKDNINYTRSLPDLRQQKSDIYNSKLFNDVRDIMSGEYKVSDDGDIQFISTARKNNKFDIPLHIASSSARELSDLYFYLRHAAQKNHLLIIDEPESHLDTKNQRQMARLLGRIVKSGIRVLVTTHSDYLIKEINNLVMLNKLDDQKTFDKFGYNSNESIAPNSIRAYIAEKKGLKACTVDNYGIDMPVFDDTIDDINEISNTLTLRMAEKEGS